MSKQPTSQYKSRRKYMTDCEPNYKNLNRIQSFSEQRYVTVQLMEQACQNDEYLKQYCDKLNYLSPPAVRRPFKPLTVDPENSWGYEQSTTDGSVYFSPTKQDIINVDFTDMDLIGTAEGIDFIALNPAEVEPSNPTEETGYNSVVPAAESYETDPEFSCELTSTHFVNDERTHDTSTKNTGDVDGYWYVGFNKDKDYYVRPDWLKDPFDSEIPSVVRAQTFKAKKSGRLKSVTLSLDYTGGNRTTCGSPLYIQIWPTYKKKVKKRQWDATQKKEVVVKDSNNKPVYEKIPWPKNKAKGKPKDWARRHHPMAQAKFEPTWKNKGGYNIKFKKRPWLTKGHTYAIVLFSPLSEYKHCPLIGGFTKHEDKEKYADGNAFFSKNNSRTFERYGYNNIDPKTKEVSEIPKDFFFKLHMILGAKTTVQAYGTDTRYMYLKPIYRSNITTINVNANDNKAELASGNKGTLTYQFSTDNKTWTNIDTTTKTLAQPSNVILIRAVMKSNDAATTPRINNITITLGLAASKEMYVRTPFVNTPAGQMLSGHIWSRIYAPWIAEANTECTAEIVRSKPARKSFSLIDIEDIEEYIEDLDIEAAEFLALNSEDDKVLYLHNDPAILNKLKEHDVYVKPEIVDEVLYKLSFKPTVKSGVVESDDMLAGLQVNDNVSYHILDCEFQSKYLGNTSEFEEWIHYTFDYTTNELFLKKSVLDDLASGVLEISYYPTFLDQLTLAEVGDKEDGSEQGLILDYFQEDINITNTMMVNRRVPLRVAPVDPIREVTLHKGTEDEKRLVEGRDYDMDLTTNELVFYVNSNDGVSSAIKLNDTLTVVYTPNLDDEKIAIGYHAKRTTTKNQLRIKENYIEYKV